MTASTPKTVVVEIDGLWFRFQKYRYRRSTRAIATMTRLFGAGIVEVVSSAKFADGTEAEQLKAMSRLLSVSGVTGGKGTDPDALETGLNELFTWSGANGGEGVCISDVDPDTLDADQAARCWRPFKNMATLDAYDGLNYFSSLAMLWEVAKQNFRPISAGSGTSRDTAPADATSSASDPSRPSGANPATSHGSPTSPTPPSTGVTGL